MEAWDHEQFRWRIEKKERTQEGGLLVKQGRESSGDKQVDVEIGRLQRRVDGADAGIL